MATYNSSGNMETIFPNINDNAYRVTSPVSPRYNCIGWAAGNNTRFWWPDPQMIGYWPSDVPREVTLEAFITMFQQQGYQVCEDTDLEEDFLKVAIYINNLGTPTHAARQLPSGKWTSKLGQIEDIEHDNLEGIEGKAYGTVGKVLKKRIN